MTSSESLFRSYVKKQYPTAFIKKLPDFKMLGRGAVVGLPDYLVIVDGVTVWFEVKKVPGNTVNLLNHFTSGQLLVFPKMLSAGAVILVYCFTRSAGVRVFPFSELLEKKTISFIK